MHLYQKIAVLSLTILGLSSTAHAISDAELMKKGIWRDPKTGLMWDRCSVGQSWNGTTCTGTAIELNWQDAQDYVKKFTNQQAKGGYTDWRVPTIEEFLSIRYCSNGYFEDKTTKTISELTAQGRVEKQVVVSDGIRMTTIPTSKGKTIKTPQVCAHNSKDPALLDANIFPYDHSYYWSSSFDSNANSDFAWFTFKMKDGFISRGEKKFEYYVRAVRSE